MIALLSRYWLPISLALLAIAGLLAAGAERANHARTKQQFAEYRAKIADEARIAEAANRAKESMWRTQQEAIANEAQKDLDRVRDELATARSAGERLRVALDATRKRAAAADSQVATIIPREPSESSAGMLADMLEQFDRRAESYGRFADEIYVRGLSCEREADSIRHENAAVP